MILQGLNVSKVCVQFSKEVINIEAKIKNTAPDNIMCNRIKRKPERRFSSAGVACRQSAPGSAKPRPRIKNTADSVE